MVIGGMGIGGLGGYFEVVGDGGGLVSFGNDEEDRCLAKSRFAHRPVMIAQMTCGVISIFLSGIRIFYYFIFTDIIQ